MCSIEGLSYLIYLGKKFEPSEIETIRRFYELSSIDHVCTVPVLLNLIPKKVNSSALQRVPLLGLLIDPRSLGTYGTPKPGDPIIRYKHIQKFIREYSVVDTPYVNKLYSHMRSLSVKLSASNLEAEIVKNYLEDDLIQGLSYADKLCSATSLEEIVHIHEAHPSILKSQSETVSTTTPEANMPVPMSSTSNAQVSRTQVRAMDHSSRQNVRNSNTINAGTPLQRSNDLGGRPTASFEDAVVIDVTTNSNCPAKSIIGSGVNPFAGIGHGWFGQDR